MNDPEDGALVRDGNDDDGFIVIELPEGITEVVFDGNGD